MIATRITAKFKESGDISHVLKIFAIAILYFVGGKIGLGLAFIDPSVSSVWPPTGIAIAALYILGDKVWPSVFLGAFFVSLTTYGSFFTSLGIACGNTIEAVLAVYFIDLFIPDRNIFFRPLDVVRYSFFSGIVATYVSAAVGVICLYLSGLITLNSVLPVGLTWWLGDIGGALIIAPFLILWKNNYKIEWKPRKFLEFIFVLSLISFIIYYTFVDGIPTLTQLFPFIFMTIPFIIFLAVRFSPRETATAILFLYLITLWQSLGYLNISIKESSNLSLQMIHIFICILFIAFMPLAADVYQRKHLEGSLKEKVKQQETLSVFGLNVLSGNNLNAILRETVELIYKTLKIDYCKIQKLLPGEKELLIIEGIGWNEELSGKTKLSADPDTLAGYTLSVKEPVIVSDLTTDLRFHSMPILSDHNIVSCISCIIYGVDKPYGVLDAHSKTKKIFTNDDIFFFQSVANMLGMAIERFAYEEQLLSSLREKQILIKEIHHRVKNNLQIVSSLLNLQSSQISDRKMLDIFSKSKSRINSMALIHKLLYNNENLSKINFKDYLTELLKVIIDSFGSPGVQCTINAEDVFLGPDQATNLGLIVNEIVTNSIKHAFPDDKMGLISVDLINTDHNVKLVIKDNGIGLAPDFDLNSNITLGTQLINNLMQQVPGTISLENDGGTKYILSFNAK
ncbi:MAG TPA: MASE1 domain-containing protein [Ignavibacteriaceae bacterium]|nr:MASE1 domain-containing protein [Ignavibacteriaceae bacterium]